MVSAEKWKKPRSTVLCMGNGGTWFIGEQGSAGLSAELDHLGALFQLK